MPPEALKDNPSYDYKLDIFSYQNVMPPEALKANPSYDYKLDIFSYDCLILHVFTHRWPIFRDQYKENDLKLLDLVSEWDGRSKYTTPISSDNPFHFIYQVLSKKTTFGKDSIM